MNPAQINPQGAGRFQVQGELTFASVAALMEQAAELFSASDCVLDLAAVERADSAGLALLIHWLRQARRQGCELRLLHVPEQMLAMARVSGLEPILPLGTGAAA